MTTDLILDKTVSTDATAAAKAEMRVGQSFSAIPVPSRRSSTRAERQFLRQGVPGREPSCRHPNVDTVGPPAGGLASSRTCSSHTLMSAQRSQAEPIRTVILKGRVQLAITRNAITI